MNLTTPLQLRKPEPVGERKESGRGLPLSVVRILSTVWFAPRVCTLPSRCEISRLGAPFLALLLTFSAFGQGQQASPQTNAVMEAGDLSQTNDVPDTEDTMTPEEAPSTEGLAQTNAPAQTAKSDARSRRLRRQRQNQANAFGGIAGQNGVSGTNGNPLDYAAFRTVADKNIFDPNRYPHSGGRTRTRTTPVDSFTLVGIMSYEKGTFAFFDGSSSEYRKTLKATGSIAGYTIKDIAPNTVKLADGTNQVELHVGTRMRREEDGPWVLTSSAEVSAANPSPSTTTSAADALPPGPESDILKKLMQRREQE